MIVAGPRNKQGPQGPQGPEGPQGPQGETGPAPEHEWVGSRLRFKNPDGTWGQLIDLKGDKGKDGAKGDRGPRGPMGIEGPPGSGGGGSALEITRTALQNISAAKAVYAVDDNQVDTSDFSVIGKQRVIGITRTAANAGADIKIVTDGIYEDAIFSGFQLNKSIYVGANGALTQTKPTTGVLLEVGYYLGQNKIEIEIQRPIKLLGA